MISTPSAGFHDRVANMGIFETFYDSFMVPLDRLGLRRWRRWATAVAGERILEIGVGSGLNLPHYSGTKVFAYDPEPQMLSKAKGRAHRVHADRVILCRSRGEMLPFADGVFDAAVGTLVFCTIQDPACALRELRRVLKPAAPVRLVEHVRWKNHMGAHVLDFLTPTWRRIAGGCHLNRDTLEEIENADFTLQLVEESFGGILLGIEVISPVQGVDQRTGKCLRGCSSARHGSLS